LKLHYYMEWSDTVMLEPTHLMYWNSSLSIATNFISLLEPTHLMYWNEVSGTSIGRPASWTDTFDVLKLVLTYSKNARTDLNRHIWCIETRDIDEWGWNTCYLNRHIWCIETYKQAQGSCLFVPWTDTFDVLKRCPYPFCPKNFYTWTDTFDVLKLSFFGTLSEKFVRLEPTHLMYWNKIILTPEERKENLNRHIWCIETKLFLILKRPTVTLNRHIWCIETKYMYGNVGDTLILNRHIWCIETG